MKMIKINSGYIFMAVIFILLGTAASLIFEHPGFALNLIKYAFYLSVAAAILHILETRHENIKK